MRANATIREVAREAGVSIQTVSNVLNRRRGVAADTRQRVLAVAERLGYRPNAAARSLRSGRSNAVGLLLADIANPYFAEVARGAEDAAHARGHSVLIGSTDGREGRGRELLGLLRAQRVAGVLVSADPADGFADLVVAFAEEAAVVQIGPAVRPARLAGVLTDDFRGGYVAAGHLLSLGRQRVAIISGPLRPRPCPGALRLEGYRRALGDWGRAFDPNLIVEGRFTFRSGYEAVDQLLAADPAPDGIVAGNDLTAIGALLRMRERGVRVPDDIAVIGYDDAEVGRMYDPPISTIAQPTYDLGRRGMELLFEQLDASERDPGSGPPERRVETLDCTLLVRRSSSGRDGEIDCGVISGKAPWLVCLDALGSRR